MEGKKAPFRVFPRKGRSDYLNNGKPVSSHPLRAETGNPELGGPLCPRSRDCRPLFYSCRKMPLGFGGAGSACPVLPLSRFLVPFGRWEAICFQGKQRKKKALRIVKGLSTFFSAEILFGCGWRFRKREKRRYRRRCSAASAGEKFCLGPPDDKNPR